MNKALDLTVMMYHYVRDRGDEAESGSGILGMTVGAFESQLDALSQQHTFVTWPQVRMALQTDQPLPDSACLLTFDDGIRDHYVNVFKVLRARNLSGLFFALARQDNEGLTLAHKIHFLLAKLGLLRFREVFWENLNLLQRRQFLYAEQRYRPDYPSTSIESQTNLLKAILQRELSEEIDELLRELLTNYVGPEQEIARSYYLSADQVREMSAGSMHFGGHSRSHPWFDWIEAGVRTTEIKASAEWLHRFEPGPWAFAYPYGGLTEDSPQILKQHGFVAAFTTQTQYRHANPFFIGRLDGEEIAQEGQGYA